MERESHLVFDVACSMLYIQYRGLSGTHRTGGCAGLARGFDGLGLDRFFGCRRVEGMRFASRMPTVPPHQQAGGDPGLSTMKPSRRWGTRMVSATSDRGVSGKTRSSNRFWV